VPETGIEAELPAEGRVIAPPEEVIASEDDALPRLVLVPPQQIDLDGAERRGVLGQLPVEVVGVTRPERRVVVQDQVEPLHALLLETPHCVLRDAHPVARVRGQGEIPLELRGRCGEAADEDLGVPRPPRVKSIEREASG
jgi:hypothetical protein